MKKVKLKLSASLLSLFSSIYNMQASFTDDFDQTFSFEKNIKVSDAGNFSKFIINSKSRHFFDETNPSYSYDLVNVSTNFILNPLQEKDEKNVAYNFYELTLTPCDQNLIELVQYSPSTTGITTSYSSGSNWDISAGIGMFGGIPTANIGGGYGQNKNTSETLPPIQILTTVNENSITWHFKIFGLDETNATFKSRLDSLWRVNQSLREKTEYFNNVSFTLHAKNGLFRATVVDDKDKIITDPVKLVQFLGKQIVSVTNPFGGLIVNSLAKDSHQEATFKIDINQSENKSYTFNSNSNVFDTSLPLRSYRWFLPPDSTTVSNITVKNDHITAVQRNNLVYAAYEIENSSSKDGNSIYVKFAYSSDNIHWYPSKAQLPAEEVSSITHSNILNFNDDLYIAYSIYFPITDNQTSTCQKGNNIKLYKLPNGESNWVNIALPTTVITDWSRPSLAVFNNRIHLFYTTAYSDLYKIPKVIVSSLGEQYTDPFEIISSSMITSLGENLRKKYMTNSTLNTITHQDRIFLAYTNKNNNILFGSSRTGISNWNFKEIDLNLSLIRGPELFIKNDNLYLFYQKGSLSVLQYCLKTNLYNKTVNNLTTSTKTNYGTNFSIFKFDNMYSEKLDLYTIYANNNILTTDRLELETNYKQYEEQIRVTSVKVIQ